MKWCEETLDMDILGEGLKNYQISHEIIGLMVFQRTVSLCYENWLSKTQTHTNNIAYQWYL